MEGFISQWLFSHLQLESAGQCIFCHHYLFQIPEEVQGNKI